ncbi:MAG: hypothetical protein ACOCXA_00980, partial [Planctomycetota bacterium]
MRILLLLLCSPLLLALEVHLHPQVSVAAPVAHLRDIARLQGSDAEVARVADIVIQHLPDAGQRRLEAEAVFALVQRERPGMRICVHGSSLVERAVQRFSPEQLCAAAIAVIRAQDDDPELLLRVVSAPDPVTVPADDEAPARLQAEALTSNELGERPFRVRVLRGQQELDRCLLVLQLQRPVPVATVVQDLPRGHVLRPQDVR